MRGACRPGPLPGLASAARDPDAELTPNLQPTGVPLDTGCSALGAGPGATRAAPVAMRRESSGLKQSGLTRLADAENTANALESRFDLAYNASHALSLAALRRAGYRSANRYIVFQALPHTLGVGPEVWRVLAKCHDVRNRGEYEGDLYVDERLVADLIHTCKLVAAALDKPPPLVRP